jgi:hypothetical protein
MIKPYLVFISIFVGSCAYSQTQYASSVIDFSSEYDAGDWGANQVIGAPNTPDCGDYTTAWASADADNQREFLVLGYAVPQKVNKIQIFQNLNPGAIDTVYLRNAATGVWTTVFSTTAIANATCPGTLTIDIALTTYKVDAVRIAMNSPAVADWNEIDAVAIEHTIVLPVYILSFTAGIRNEEVLLKWSTATEINAAHFEVERSSDGIAFEKITALPAKNAINGSAYQVIDPSPFTGINFYRLKMADIDGKIAYSPVAIINFQKKGLPTVSPNPANSFITIKGIEKLKRIQLMDSNGKIVKELYPTADGRYSIRNLKAGVYILKLMSAGGIQSQKLMIQ